jgi:hypothetical protein
MSTKYADDASTEHARNALAQEKKIVERSRAEYAERSKGKPTPTQEELDMSMLGARILEHEDDGSGPDPYDQLHRSKQLEGERSGTKPQSYQTRQSTSKTSE